MSTIQEPPASTRPAIWEELLGAEVRFYNAGGVRTRSIQAGSGEAVIMLHGVGGHAEAFARNIVPLSRHFDARAIDYYGHGLTEFGSMPFSKDAYVKHLLDYMDAAGIKKAHLIGESLGGWIAAWTAIEHPERVGKVIYTVGAMLNVPIPPEVEQRQEIGLQGLKRLSKQFNDDPSRENVHERLKWLFHKPERDITKELIDLRWALYQRDLGKPKPPIGTESQHEFGPENLAKIKAPFMFLWTSDNPSGQKESAMKAMEYVENAEWALIDDAGHWPQWEHPEIFNQIVTDYLKK